MKKRTDKRGIELSGDNEVFNWKKCKNNGPWSWTELRAFAVGRHASMKDEFMLLRGKIHGGPHKMENKSDRKFHAILKFMHRACSSPGKKSLFSRHLSTNCFVINTIRDRAGEIDPICDRRTTSRGISTSTIFLFISSCF